MKYIVSEKSADGCIFCQKSHEADDGRNYVLVRERTCFALLNLYPYTNGHLMVAPYKHTADLDGLTDDEMGDLMVLTRRCQQLLRKASRAEGFNIGLNIGKVAGAGIAEHLHVHIVPRWGGDVNFMGVLGNTRVVPESLDATYQKLREALASR